MDEIQNEVPEEARFSEVVYAHNVGAHSEPRVVGARFGNQRKDEIEFFDYVRDPEHGRWVLDNESSVEQAPAANEGGKTLLTSLSASRSRIALAEWSHII